eukprot:Blabericola_migrator_1__12584@NODE_7_length_25668_cov_124_338502_g6_i0_p14_GENE_NODE_7_length_25668_cov_124_338502_g6_i0NODE_7_length_25668_cov_124_338502_g6_i0_p14_ORF_typecomplete_len200_score23_32HTH_38/PF13936_6/0_13_NODE_7_length_25668_cov_124_338502_g6_i060926691
MGCAILHKWVGLGLHTYTVSYRHFTFEERYRLALGFLKMKRFARLQRAAQKTIRRFSVERLNPFVALVQSLIRRRLQYGIYKLHEASVKNPIDVKERAPEWLTSISPVRREPFQIPHLVVKAEAVANETPLKRSQIKHQQKRSKAHALEALFEATFPKMSSHQKQVEKSGGDDLSGLCERLSRCNYQRYHRKVVAGLLT